MNFYVYILFSESHNKFYIGQTSDLEQRINRHNSGYEQYTRPFAPWKLVWYCVKPSRSQAMNLERKLKNLNKARLSAFIENHSNSQPWSIPQSLTGDWQTIQAGWTILRQINSPPASILNKFPLISNGLLWKTKANGHCGFLPNLSIEEKRLVINSFWFGLDHWFTKL